MRYMVRRVRGGPWLDRDLPLEEVTRTRSLTAPSVLSATVREEWLTEPAADGYPLLDPWRSIVYAVSDDGSRVRGAGLWVDASLDETTMKADLPGVAVYPRGMVFTNNRIWGPRLSDDLPRPDPLVIVHDLWAWLQQWDQTDLGVRMVGATSTERTVGTYAEPFRLRKWEAPDVGQTIDSLCSETPFDYVEEYGWVDGSRDEVDHRLRWGWPRLGTKRTDLRFALGENVVSTPGATLNGSSFANDVVGLGNGDGPRMVYARATVDDGRLRRTRVVTDKAQGQAWMQNTVARFLARMSASVEVTSVVIDGTHPNAPASSIAPGDDIFVRTALPVYGEVALWLRVTAITETDGSDQVTLTTARSDSFIYNPRLEVA